MSIADPQQPGRALFGAPVFVDLQRDIALWEFHAGACQLNTAK